MSAGNWKDLFIATQQGDLELVSFHLRSGVDPNYQHPEFMTAPLHECIRLKQLAIARLLLDNGAKPDLKEVWTGDTPMGIALKNKDQSSIQLLQSFLKEED